jgi:hypothetical protein
MFNQPGGGGSGPIRIGYLKSDSFFPVCLTGERAIKEVVDCLSNDSRFQLVDLNSLNINNKYFDTKHMIRTFIGLMSAEGKLRNFFRLLKGDQIIKEYKLMVASSRVPSFLKPLVVKLLRCLGEDRLSWVIGSTNELSYDEY